MAKFLSTMLVGVCLSGLFFGALSRHATADPSADAEKKDTPSAATRIAVIDSARVYTKSKIYQQYQNEWKTKVSESQETSRKLIKEIQQLTEKRKGLDQGSEERKELENLLKRKQAELSEFHAGEAKKFQKEQATIYLTIYQKVVPEIATYAQAHGIDLVLAKQPEPVKEDDPVKLLQSLSRNVIYENKLDITDEIIEAMADL